MDILQAAVDHGELIAKQIGPIIIAAPVARRGDLIERAGSYFRSTLPGLIADIAKIAAPWEIQEFRDAAEMVFTHELTKQTLER